MIQTIIVDNGKEFALHKEITPATQGRYLLCASVSFLGMRCERKYERTHSAIPPKGVSFEGLTEEYVQQIQQQLNNRPRKSLGYLTPKEYAFAKFGIVIM